MTEEDLLGMGEELSKNWLGSLLKKGLLYQWDQILSC